MRGARESKLKTILKIVVLRRLDCVTLYICVGLFVCEGRGEGEWADTITFDQLY